MSWSVNAVGKPAAVKAALKKQFETAKLSTARIPHEHNTVISIEYIVNDNLDFMDGIPETAIRVEASGSAYRNAVGDKVVGGTQVTLRFDQIYGFVE